MKADLTQVQQALRANPDLLCLIGMASPPRPGVTLLFTMIEWRYFRPRTRRNRDFEMLLTEFNGVVFAACIVKRSMIPPGALEAMLAEALLEMDNQQLHVLGGANSGAFPLSGENVYHLTFVSGHPAYGKHDADAMDREEKEKVAEEEGKPEPDDLPTEPPCLPTGRRYTSVEQMLRGEGITIDLQ